MDKLKVGRRLVPSAKKRTKFLGIDIAFSHSEAFAVKDSLLSKYESALDPRVFRDGPDTKISPKSICYVKAQSALWDWAKYYAEKHPDILDDVQGVFDELDRVLNTKLARSLLVDKIPVKEDVLNRLTASAIGQLNSSKSK